VSGLQTSLSPTSMRRETATELLRRRQATESLIAFTEFTFILPITTTGVGRGLSDLTVAPLQERVDFLGE
jgi:hypothetical protein